MKFLVGDTINGSATSYAFNAAAQTVTLTLPSNINLEQVLSIVNTDFNIIIYAPPIAGKGGTIALNVITLDYNTAAMNNADRLQIFIDFDTTLEAQGLGVAGTQTGGVLTIQGDPAGTPIPVTASFTPSGTQDVNLKEVVGTTTSVNTGNSDAGTQRVVLASDQPAVAITGALTQVQLATELDEKFSDLGQQAMAASASVVIASDQSAVPVSVSGVATAANQVTEIAFLTSIDAGTPAGLGQTTMAASQPVVIASDQTAVPISGTVTITPSGTQDENLKQVNGITVDVGIGTAGTGTQRVAVASNSSITANAGTNLNTSLLATEANLSGVSGATGKDNSVFTVGTTRVMMAGYELDDIAPSSVTEGFLGAARMSANRNQYTTIRDAAGNERGANVSAGNALLVDGSAATQPISGTVDITELPAAAALTDNFANPTTTNLAAMNMVWDGATWDRAAGTSADGTLVNLGANNDVTLNAGSAIIGTVAIDQTTPGTTNGVALKDGIGTAINSLTAGTGQNGLMIAIGATNYVLSTVNSSVAQLAAGATFTGTIETIFNEPCISILLTTDQNGVLTINQYIDLAGTFRANQISFQITANVPLAKSFVLNGNYVNVVFQNTGYAATTTLNLNTAYGTIPAATILNNTPSAINEVNGYAVDARAGNSSGGTQRVILATDTPETTGEAISRNLLEYMTIYAKLGLMTQQQIGERTGLNYGYELR